MSYQLALEHYQGPLDKLLELIEERKLSINEVSLAQVTEDFLAYIRTLPAVTTSLLADFIVIASRLLFLKSKSLLPDFSMTEEEAKEIKELEARLIVYRDLRPSFRALSTAWRGGVHSFGRPYLLLTPREDGERVFFHPGINLTRDAIEAAAERLSAAFAAIHLETETLKKKIVTIEEKIKEIIERLKGKRELSFQTLSHTKPTPEIIAIFLAVLHLAREQRIFLEQRDHFSDILIKNPKRET